MVFTAGTLLAGRAVARLPGTGAALMNRVSTQFGPNGPARNRLAELAATDRFAGAVGIGFGEKTVFAEAYGLANRAARRPNRLNTRFDIASMGKLFTALAIGRQVETGRLRWTDKAGSFVPNLPLALADFRIEELLSHTSGLGSYFDSPRYAALSKSGKSVSDYMQAVVDDAERLGTRGSFRYSNNGYVLLGAILERVTGRDYCSAVDKLVFRPAGMISTGYPIEPGGADVAVGYTKGCFGRPPNVCTRAAEWSIAERPLRGTPAGGALSTVPDLLRLGAAIRNHRIISAATLHEMLKPRVSQMPPGAPIDAQGLGFGIANLIGTDTFGHNGGTIGFGSQIDMTEEPPLTIVVLSNVDDGQRAASGTIRSRLFADA
jgi:CubicO group peptidase (beta-lactamase class C family)